MQREGGMRVAAPVEEGSRLCQGRRGHRGCGLSKRVGVASGWAGHDCPQGQGMKTRGLHQDSMAPLPPGTKMTEEPVSAVPW